MGKNTQAKLQMLGNVVKEFSLNCEHNIDKSDLINLNGELGFRIINISEEKNEYFGQIELVNNIDIFTDDKREAKIHISMIGVFKGSTELGKEKFEEMLKINGAITLSHLVRSYIQVVTSLSGMPTIITPMVNFVEFFKGNGQEVQN